MLDIVNITYQLPGFLLKNINVTINKGEYWIILGESGSGKTILLDILAGFKKPSKGKIYKNNEDITHVPIYKRGFSYVTAQNSLFPHLSVKKNIAFQQKVDNVQLNKIINWFNLKSILNKYPKELSSGESQRVALARALVSNSEILLLDEPLSSVDASARYEIMLLLRQMHREGYTIVHVTHDFQEALILSQKVAIMHSGELIQTGTMTEILKNPVNPFVAKLTGIKNVFYAHYLGDDKYEINNKITIISTQEVPVLQAMIIISSNDIVLSTMPLHSSMQNQFKGKIVDILIQPNAVDVLVDIGIILHATITHRSLNDMKLTHGDEIWINFKASAVNVIPAPL
ncbi:MAG: ABC transporter ATP-binding protein [Bacteroidales bacterium]|nr:ABC transporter ATP-binding protein [Bacteroidales bacterium]